MTTVPIDILDDSEYILNETDVIGESKKTTGLLSS